MKSFETSLFTVGAANTFLFPVFYLIIRSLTLNDSSGPRGGIPGDTEDDRAATRPHKIY